MSDYRVPHTENIEVAEARLDTAEQLWYDGNHDEAWFVAFTAFVHAQLAAMKLRSYPANESEMDDDDRP